MSCKSNEDRREYEEMRREQRDFTRSFSQLQSDIYRTAKSHGWWPDNKTVDRDTLYPLVRICVEAEKVELQRKGFNSEIGMETRYYGQMMEVIDTFNPEELFIAQKLMLVSTEVREAFDSIKDPEHLAEELADIVIRVMSLAGGLNLDLAQAIIDKTEKNKNRPYKHGNKRF